MKVAKPAGHVAVAPAGALYAKSDRTHNICVWASWSPCLKALKQDLDHIRQESGKSFRRYDRFFAPLLAVTGRTA